MLNAPLEYMKCILGVLFLLYRKFLKLSEIVYNRTEIKNRMTKERRVHFAMTLFMKFFVSVQWWLHYLTVENLSCVNGTTHIP